MLCNEDFWFPSIQCNKIVCTLFLIPDVEIVIRVQIFYNDYINTKE